MSRLTSINDQPILPNKNPRAPKPRTIKKEDPKKLRKIKKEIGIYKPKSKRTTPEELEAVKLRVQKFFKLLPTKGPRAIAKYSRINRMKNEKYLYGESRMKTCSVCGEKKPPSAFDLLYDKKHKKGYRRSYCFTCRAKMDKRRVLTKEQDDRKKEYNRQYYLRRKNDTKRVC
jgi:hypothetical protein